MRNFSCRSIAEGNRRKNAMKSLRQRILLSSIALLFLLAFWQRQRLFMTLPLSEITLLGIVQGITEFLPISSTAHLILLEHLFSANSPKTLRSVLGIYNEVIQTGSILAVPVFYGSRFLSMARGLLGRSAEGLGLNLKLLLAFFPAAIFGFSAGEMMQNCGNSLSLLLWPMAIGGFYILLFEKLKGKNGHRSLESLTYRESFLIGLMQCLAFFPGVSRLLMTLTAGLWFGLSAGAALEFSFLLGFLTIASATLFKLATSGALLFWSIPPIPLIYGSLLAFFVAFLTMGWILGYLAKNSLMIFGYYRILLATVIALVLWTSVL